MSKLIIVTAMHERYELTEAFCMAAKRIKNDTGVETVAVITEGDKQLIALCKKYGLRYTEHKNNPVGEKLNSILEFIKDDDYTHILVLGSDDIVSSSFIEEQKKLLDYDLVGVNDIWFWGINPSRVGFKTFGYWQINKTAILGVGRMISRKIIERCENKLWSDKKNSRLDGLMMSRIKKFNNMKTIKTYHYSLKSRGLFIVDIKIGPNISSLSPTLKDTEKMNAYATIKQFLPEDEVEYLMKLYELQQIKATDHV